MKVEIKNIWLLIISLATPLLVGFFGSLLTTPGVATWYSFLTKPWFNPPNWIFSPVWTLLFVLMGLALFLVLKEGRKNSHFAIALIVFAAQLFLNLYWSFFFFFVQAPSLAFYEIISLWLMILVNIYYFYQIKKTAAYLLIPYLAWVSFAAVLNYFIWSLN